MKKTVVGTLVSTALVVLSVSPQTIQIPDSPGSSYNWDQFKSSNGLRFTGDAAQTIEADVITVKDRLKRIITSIQTMKINMLVFSMTLYHSRQTKKSLKH